MGCATWQSFVVQAALGFPLQNREVDDLWHYFIAFPPPPLPTVEFWSDLLWYVEFGVSVVSLGVRVAQDIRIHN